MSDYASATTRRLHRALREREPAARDELFARYLDALARRARRHHVPGYTADDLLHEACARALHALERGSLDDFEPRGRGALLRWLGRVLANTAADLVRLARTEKRPPSAPAPAADPTGGGLDMTATPDPSPTSNARRDELVSLCRRTLTDREWDVWSAVELGGKSIVEAARAAGASDSAARSLVHRARAKLVAALADGPHLDGA